MSNDLTTGAHEIIECVRSLRAENTALVARVRELEAALAKAVTALATATEQERARCLGICRGRVESRKSQAQHQTSRGATEAAMICRAKGSEASACADEIERGMIWPSRD